MSPGWNRPTLTAAVINASILVSLLGWAMEACIDSIYRLPWLGRRLPGYTLRYRDTLADDIVIPFFLTIRALSSVCLLFPLGCSGWICEKNIFEIFFGIPLLFVTYDNLNMLYKFQSYMIMFTDSSTTPKFTKVDSVVLINQKEQ